MIAFQLALQMLLTMLVGVIARRTKLIDAHGVSCFSKVLLNVGVPCLIVHSMNLEFKTEEFRAGLIMLLLSVIVMAVLFVAGWLYRRAIRDPMRGGVGHFSIMFPNFAFVGNPVMESLYGATGLFYLTIFVTPVRVLFYALPAFLMAPGSRKSLREILRVFLSPQLVALYVGLLIYLCRIPLPQPLSRTLSSMAAFTSAGGMVFCGMLIADADRKALLRKPAILILPLLRNLAAPLLILAVMWALPFDPLCRSVAVMFAALPMAANTNVLLVKYSDDRALQREVSLCTMLSTVLCVGTLPLLFRLTEYVL